MKFAATLALTAISVQAGDYRPNNHYGAPHQDHSSHQPTYGYLGEDSPTYGVYRAPRAKKALIANDGYRVKARTDPYERLYETVNAKCVLMDPEEESYASGVVYFSQGAKDRTTSIWGEIWGIDYANLTINALGDMTKGCESAGEVFNPSVSSSGYGYGKEPTPAPGILNEIHGSFDQQANVDLSGNQSIIGRSMVLTRPGSKDEYGNGRPDVRVACCTIGLAAGAKKPEPQYHAPPQRYHEEPEPQYHAPPQRYHEEPEPQYHAPPQRYHEEPEPQYYRREAKQQQPYRPRSYDW